MAMVKVGTTLSAIEDSKTVLYGGYRVEPITTNGEKGYKRSGIYQLIAPDGSRKVFEVAAGIVAGVAPWNTNPAITEVK